jgi:hypothetical protein
MFINSCSYLVFALLLMFNRVDAAIDDTLVVAKVGSELVTKREFLHRTKTERAEVIRYFRNTYQCEYGQGFWTKSFNGISPSEMLKQRTLDALIRIKVQQMAARENGIKVEMQYDRFLQELDSVNARRLADKKANKVIYGPVQYTEDVYFSYTFSNMVNSLKILLDEKEFKITDDELKLFYEKKKDSLFRKGYNSEIQLYSLQLKKGEKGKVNEEMLTRFLAIRYCAPGTEQVEIADMRQILEKYPELSLSVKDISCNDSIYSGEEGDGLTAIVKERAGKLDEGQFSGNFEYRGAHMFFKIEKKRSLGYRSFSSCGGTIKSNLLDSEYEKYIQKRLLLTKVEINKEVYDGLSVNQ